MERSAAQQLVRDTLQNSFDKERFIYFTKNLLNSIDESKAFHARGYVKEKFKQQAEVVKTYERLGTYTDPDNKKIDILVVYLEKERAIERARTTLRNFVADYLNQRDQKDAGLIAFVSPDPDDWRLSFVKMEYRIMETPTGRIKAEQDFTPAKRYSFLVGKNETSHTAQSQFVPVLEDDLSSPTLQRIESIFDIEKVTREFFDKYRELYLRVRETLGAVIGKDQSVKRDFKEKNIHAVDFSKKLLGQIVFLYFLQRKGWFGVKRGEDWGSGSKRFLRELFEKKHGGYENFFNEILEPLFYEALRNDRSHDDHYFSMFKCKIPFLNGGLFDPINNYDWGETDILLPNDLFSNSYKTKEGDIGTGILDVFDRYNFTVKEDEPLEKEVAVDPEMLGKVFENLLEVIDRKSTGTFYTPREVVHYMCQESLTSYLASELEGKVTREEVETLIKFGEAAVEHDMRVENHGKETPTYSYKLSESIRKNAKTIDEKLAKIRVCDPAVGSGAFLVGIMSEIIRTRSALTPYLKEKKGRTLYDFKRDAIQNSLYGVDIDAGAVEIAKLRLWLSLVVDEEDIKQVKPLPNLDYKIMHGNSLIEILTSEILIGTADQEKNELVSQLKKAKEEFFGITSPSLKNERRYDIESLLSKIIGHDRKVALRNLNSKILAVKNQGKLFVDKQTELSDRSQISLLERNVAEIENTKLPGPSEHFEWHLNFPEVFQEEEGFDVVIANPPYFQIQKLNERDKLSLEKSFKTFSKTSDIYCLFYERAITLLRQGGISTFITSNSWLRAQYGKLLRRFLIENANPLQLVNFEDLQIFEAAIVETNILLTQRCPWSHALRASTVKNDVVDYSSFADYIKENNVILHDLDDDGWAIANEAAHALKKKLELGSTLLKDYGVTINFGIKTGFNDAFVIDELTKNNLTTKDKKSLEIIRPLLRGRDIQKWRYDFAGQYLINTHNGIKEKRVNRVNVSRDYPAIFRHLESYKAELQNRQDVGDHWTNLRNCAYLEDFEKPKIIWGEISDRPKFAFDSKGYFCTNTTFFMVGIHLKYLLAVLNSKISEWYFSQISTSSGMGTTRWFKYKIELLPIKEPSASEEQRITVIVNKLLALTGQKDYSGSSSKRVRVSELESKLDQILYKIYGLAPVEIKIIEGTK